jgi:cell division initiation protein
MQFKSRPFGYEKSGVDQFLELLADELEKLIRKNHDLQEVLARTTAALDEMRDREGTLKETLVTTQKITDDLKTNAHREADVMMAEAGIKSERLMQSAEERRLQLIEEIQEIKRQKVDFEVSLRGLLEKHIRMLDLNSVAIQQENADARMLEEPLPFMKEPSRDAEELDRGSASHTERPIEDAEFAESEPTDKTPWGSVDSDLEAKIQDLTLDFNANEENGEEGFPK